MSLIFVRYPYAESASSRVGIGVFLTLTNMGKKKVLTRKEQLFKERATNIQVFEAPPTAEKGFTRAMHYMLMHPNYKKMSSSAKVLLMYMKDWAFSSDMYINHCIFEYSTTMLANIGVMANKTQIDALKELEYYGFIQKENNATKESGITQLWSFSDSWYKQERKKYKKAKQPRKQEP